MEDMLGNTVEINNMDGIFENYTLDSITNNGIEYKIKLSDRAVDDIKADIINRLDIDVSLMDIPSAIFADIVSNEDFILDSSTKTRLVLSKEIIDEKTCEITVLIASKKEKLKLY